MRQIEVIADDVMTFAAEKLEVELKPRPTIRVYYVHESDSWRKVWDVSKYGTMNPTENAEARKISGFDEFERISASMFNMQRVLKDYETFQHVRSSKIIAPTGQQLSKKELKRRKEVLLWLIEKAQAQDFVILLNVKYYRMLLKQCNMEDKSVPYSDSMNNEDVIGQTQPWILKDLIHELLHVIEHTSGQLIVKHKEGAIWDDATNQIHESYINEGRLEQIAKKVIDQGIT